ncbi:hypothetical protein HKCCE2091_08210 [Rhodobacterales bacterium HKCCE2091]|nr:hypothetical protein [Rhodobacterales bacterium HKCCE2091]
MCLMVYLGSLAPVAGFDRVEVGGVGLDPEVPVRPAALAGLPHVARVADRVPGGWNCSCVFLDRALPWEDPDAADDADAPARRAAYATLARIAEAAGAGAALFSCWSGDEARPPAIERALAPGDLRADRYIFDDIHDGGSGATPPVLVRLTGGKGETCSARS